MASLEFAVPSTRSGEVVVALHRCAPLAGAALGGRAWFDVGRFLGPNISEHYRRFPVAATVAAWEAAGLTDVEVRRMSLGGGLVMWGRRAADHRDTGSTDA
jgi:demethylmenaquinone methyltransferase/2-methoxy-6-polyprenyl-1,4-benzoquinol methylase